MLCNAPRKLSKHTQKRRQPKKEKWDPLTRKVDYGHEEGMGLVKSPKGKPTLAGFRVIVQSNADSAAVMSAVLPDDVTSAEFP